MREEEGHEGEGEVAAAGGHLMSEVVQVSLQEQRGEQGERWVREHRRLQVFWKGRAFPHGRPSASRRLQQASAREKAKKRMSLLY